MTRCFVARASRASVVVGMLVGSAACGGPAPVLRAPSAAAASAQSNGPPRPAADTGPVTPPSTLIVSGRIGKPSSSLAVVRAWSKLPMPQSEQLTELVAGEPAGALIDVDQPIDFALALNAAGPGHSAGASRQGALLFAVSAGVRSLETAEAVLADHFTLVPGDNGALLIRGLPGSDHRAESDADRDDEDSGGRRTCELAPAYGASSTRLVCAFGDERGLAQLGPWLTRGATRLGDTSDLRIDVRVSAIHSIVSEKWRGISALFGALAGSALGAPRLGDLALGAAQDVVSFVLDLDRLSLDVALSDSAAQVEFTRNLSGTTSVLAELATANADRVGPPPAAFWQMPSDADLAVFGRGVDPAIVGPARDEVIHLLNDALAGDGIRPADGNAILDALRQFPLGTAGAYAAGVDADAVSKAMALAAASPRTEESERSGLWASANALLGWHVAEIEAPAAEMTTAIKALMAAWSRPGVVSAYHAGSGGLAALHFRAAPVPKGRVWPDGSQHDVVELQPPPPRLGVRGKAPASVGPMAFHVLVVPDGSRTWVGVGGDEALTAAKLAGALAGSGDTLQSRAELAPWKEARVGEGGFVTGRGLFANAVGLMALASSFEDPTAPIALLPLQAVADAWGDLRRLPAGGATPVTFTSTSSSMKAPASVVTSIGVPRAAVEDAIVWVLRHHRF
jgi:hypothetical protein